MLKISWSERSAFQMCPRNYYYKYILNKVPIFFSKALNFGSMFHEMVNNLYIFGEEIAKDRLSEAVSKVDVSAFSQEDFDELNWQVIVLTSMLNNIAENFLKEDKARGMEIIESEKYHVTKFSPSFTVRPVSSFRYEYIPDLLIRDAKGDCWLIEYKTTSRLGQSYFERLQIDEQTNGMMYFLEKLYNIKIKGIIFRIIKKPGIRQTKKESTSEFFDRLGRVMTDDYSSYFYEQVFIRDQKLLDEFEQNLYKTIKAMRYTIKNQLYYKDTSKCSIFNCSYLPLCCNLEGGDELYKNKESRIKEEEGEGEV